MNSKCKIYAVVTGIITLINAGNGLECLIEGVAKRNLIRQEAYAKSEQITPRVIHETELLLKKVGENDYRGIFDLGGAGLCGMLTYFFARKRD